MCGKHFNLKSDYCFHLKKHKTKINFLNVNNNYSVETDYSVTSRMENAISNSAIIKECSKY